MWICISVFGCMLMDMNMFLMGTKNPNYHLCFESFPVQKIRI